MHFARFSRKVIALATIPTLVFSQPARNPADLIIDGGFNTTQSDADTLRQLWTGNSDIQRISS
jgi:hypothetical protein